MATKRRCCGFLWSTFNKMGESSNLEMTSFGHFLPFTKHRCLYMSAVFRSVMLTVYLIIPSLHNSQETDGVIDTDLNAAPQTDRTPAEVSPCVV